MLQVMDNMEASCVFYVKVGMLTHLEQSKISLLTVNKSGIVTLTVQHDMTFSVFSCNILGIIYDRHQQMSFPSNNILLISSN